MSEENTPEPVGETPKKLAVAKDSASKSARWVYFKVLGPLSIIGGAVTLFVWLFSVFAPGDAPATVDDIEAVLGERVLASQEDIQLIVYNVLAEERGESRLNSDDLRTGVSTIEARLLSGSARDLMQADDQDLVLAQLSVQEGRFSDAARQLETVAQSKTGNAAAKAWRESGLLSLASDPDQAIVALERSAALEPENFETQLGLSRAYLRASEDQDQAWWYAQEAVRLAQTAEQSAEAHLALGLAMQAQGELSGAVDAFRKSANSLDALTKTRPDDLTLKRLLFESQKKLYQALSRLERYDEAETVLEDALIIARSIAAQDRSLWAQEDLSLILIWYGDTMLEGRDDPLSARAAYLEALAVDEAIVAKKTDDPLARYDLLFPLKRLVDLARFTDNKRAERDLYLQMLDIEMAMNEAEPDSIWPSMLAFRHERLARLGGDDAKMHWQKAYDWLALEKAAGRLGEGDEDMMTYYAEQAQKTP